MGLPYVEDLILQSFLSYLKWYLTPFLPFLTPFPSTETWIPNEGLFPPSSVIQLASVPTCTGEDRKTTSPRPRRPLLLLPQPHRVRSILTANAAPDATPSSDHVASVPTCTGEERLTMSPRPSVP